MAKWISGAIKHPGRLRRATHAKKGKRIPAKTLNRLAKKGGSIGRAARLAKTLRGLHHR